MHKNRLITILFILLFLLLIVCSWGKSDDIFQEQQKRLHSSTEVLPKLSKQEIIEAKIQKLVDFDHINFELNQVKLTEKSVQTLQKISVILKKNPNVHIDIGGHTDDSGSEQHNLKLSQARVDAVKKTLINMGIEAKRLTAIGYGETKPIVPNDNEENRSINRRVEFKVLGE